MAVEEKSGAAITAVDIGLTNILVVQTLIDVLVESKAIDGLELKLALERVRDVLDASESTKGMGRFVRGYVSSTVLKSL